MQRQFMLQLGRQAQVWCRTPTSRKFTTAALMRQAVLTRKEVALSQSKSVGAMRHLSFSFAGPRSLQDILKKELVEDKTSTEIADIWFSYHEERENVHGIVLKGADAKSILTRAEQCPFFIQPIFRDDGFFMMISQFQAPCHFLMAYLEDYRMDPSAAQPLLTFSVFDDYAESRDLTLVRCDILNKGVLDHEGRKIVDRMLDAYSNENEFITVHNFNKTPNSFDVDDYISRQNDKWNNGPPSVTV